MFGNYGQKFNFSSIRNYGLSICLTFSTFPRFTIHTEQKVLVVMLRLLLLSESKSLPRELVKVEVVELDLDWAEQKNHGDGV